MNLRSTHRTTVLLVGLCLVLVGVAVFEWLKPPRLSPVSGEAAQPGQSVVAREPAPGNVSLPPLSKYEEIVSRPLFLADRRPPPATPETPAVPVAQQEATLLLVGVMLSPEGQRALVHLKEENRLVRLQVGESAGGWKLESLTPESATLRQGGETLELRLERNRKDGPPPPPQAAPRTPQPRTARQAPAASQPHQAPAQKGARAPAAPQQPPQQSQQAGRQAQNPPASPRLPVPAPRARQATPQPPAATPGRTAAPPTRPVAQPSVTPLPFPQQPSPTTQSPHRRPQLDAITPDMQPATESEQ